MQTGSIQPGKKSAILKGKSMAAAPKPTLEPINPLDLSNRMDIQIDVLALAVGADSGALTTSPRNTGHDDALKIVADLWSNLVVLVGDEKRARQFLKCERPELDNQTPLHVLEQGDPGTVLDLVIAMRELLP